MKRNTLFGAAGLLVAGAAIGGGAVITQNAMADDGASLTADAVTMINVDSEGNAVQCTFTGADAEGLVFPAIPTDDLLKAQGASGSGYVLEVDGTVPEIQVDGGVVVAGSIPPGAIPSGGVISLDTAGELAGGVAAGTEGEFVLGEVGADSEVIAVGEAREGTPEECAAMREQAQSGIEGIVGSGVMIDASGSVAVSNEP